LFEKREYQHEMIEAGMRGLSEDGRALWGAPTGCGKAFCLSSLAGRFIRENKKSRVLIVVDQKNLVQQLYETFKSVNPHVFDVDVACSGIRHGFDEYSKVLIASRQTLVNRIGDIGAFDLVIGDEAHEWRLLEGGEWGDSQFHSIFRGLQKKNSDLLLLGCTATPYRLLDGTIYGEEKLNGKVPVFKKLNYSVKYKTLIDDGYLAEPTFYRQRIIDRDSVSKSSTGDYNSEEAGRAIETYLDSAVDAFEKVGVTSKRPIAFCSSIHAAQGTATAFEKRGYKTWLMHSQTPDAYTNFEQFSKHGGVLVTVDQATKGFDYPPLDCALLLRLTASPAICLQQIGRVIRKCEGKEGAVVIDLVGNTESLLENNDLDLPIVKEPRPPKEEDEVDVIDLSTFKRCKNFPICQAKLTKAQMICHECGYEFPAKELKNIPIGELVEYKHGSGESYIDIEISKLNPIIKTTMKGKQYLSLLFVGKCGKTIPVSMFFRKEYNASPAVKETARTWKKIFVESVPYSVKNVKGDITIRDGVKMARMRKKGGFWNIISIG